MSSELHCTLPVPPSVNARWRVSRDGHVYVPAKVRQWEDSALLLLRRAGFRRQDPGEYHIVVYLHCYVVKSRDLDNLAKAVLDVLCEALGLDDRYVGELALSKIPTARAEQRLDVFCTVEPLPDPAAFNRRSLQKAGKRG